MVRFCSYNADRVGLGILYLCIRLTGSLITNTKMYLPSIGRNTDSEGLGILFVVREPVSLIQRYSIPSPSLSVFLPIDGKY
jgi:hypothetical protein